MALTPPTIGANPTATTVNTALTSINAFATTSFASITAVLRVVREHLRLHGGGVRDIANLDAQIGTLQASAQSDPAVVTSPADLTETNNSLVTMSAVVDLLNSRSLAGISTIRDFVRRTGIRKQLPTFDSTTAALSSPASLTAPTIATDMSSATNNNTAIAAVVAFIDNANSEMLAAINELTEKFRTQDGRKLNLQLAAAASALNV